MRRGSRKVIPVAVVPTSAGLSEYFAVDHVDTSEKEDFSGSHPYFIGIQAGFDVIRFVVYGRSEDDALETAEQRWPKFFGEEHEPEISILKKARNFFPRAKKTSDDGVVIIKPTSAQVARDHGLRLGDSFMIKLH